DAVPRDVRRVPSTAEGGQLHDRPGRREARGGADVGPVGMETLGSWRDGAAKQAIVDFVEDVNRFVPEDERVAGFDNDGTLWCEKPMPIELGFILKRLDEMAKSDPSLRDRQPWKAAHEQDHAWLAGVITKHYGGDDSELKVLLGGVLQAFAGWSVDEYA